MISIELKRTDGNFISINLPENSNELTLSQKLDFDFAQIGLISFLKKHENNLFNNRAGYIIQLAKGLSDFLELDLSVIMNLEGSNLLDIEQEDLLEHLEIYTKGLKGVNKQQLESSLLMLWNYIANICQADIKLVSEVEFKGQVYKLPEVNKDPISGKPIYESISTQKAVEIIQIKNNYDKFLKKSVLEDDSPDKKNAYFQMLVSEIVLLLEPEPPTDEDQFATWLRNRILHFQDIDWQTALSVQIWFNNYMEQLQNDDENYYFFESANGPDNASEVEAYAKAKSKARKVYDKVGIKGIYPVLLELNPFQVEGMDKMKSILKSKFTNVVKILSLHNSKV